MKNTLSIALFTAFISLFLLLAIPVAARVLINENGNIVFNQGQVLSSSNGSNDDDSSSGSDSSESNSSSDSDSNGSGNSDDDKTETRSEDGARAETEIRDDGEVRTEVRLPDGTRIKTRTEDDRTRADIYQGGVKIRLEREGGRFRIKVENELGEETDLGDDELIFIDERADRNQIRIRIFDSAASQLRNYAIIERLNTQALTNLPLSVNLETNELTVTTSAGERTITVLPDQAVQNMLAANVIDRIGDQALVNLIQQSGIETLNQVIRLSEQNGVPIYEIAGIKEHRLFGFISITTDVTVMVSAETGEVVNTKQSVLDTIIDIFSTSV